MEVLQTSALPLGDGAGRNWGSKLTWNGPAASRDADDSDDERQRRKASTQNTQQREDATEKDARCAPLSVARGAEPATKRWRSGTRRSGQRPRRFNIGAGNGIRTRDFDLGKVAL